MVMKLSAKGRYAVTAMVDLGLHAGDEPVALADIAECQRISLSTLEQLFARLRRAGLVRSVRGPGGGYCLTRACEAISVAEVIDAVEQPQAAGAPQEQAGCLAQELWVELGERIRQCLAGITLAELCRTPAFVVSVDCQDQRMGRRHRINR